MVNSPHTRQNTACTSDNNIQKDNITSHSPGNSHDIHASLGHLKDSTDPIKHKTELLAADTNGARPEMNRAEVGSPDLAKNSITSAAEGMANVESRSTGEATAAQDANTGAKQTSAQERASSTSVEALPAEDVVMTDDAGPSKNPNKSESAAERGIMPLEGKKRAPVKSDKKKGTASVIKKPAAKKRKIEEDSKDGTPFSQRSATPASTAMGKPIAARNRKQSSTTQSSPTRSTQMEDEDEEEEDDDGDDQVFCICRKPDDHTWMIGCDGGCEDWFHGHCVNMKERDGNLVDKYICW
jgi:hypothetical protein